MARREYENSYCSVTQILGVLRKPGLENWFKYTPIKQIQKESEEGKLIGTQIHDAIHAYIQSQEVKVKTEHAEDVMNALKGFIQFTKDRPDLKLVNSEMAFTSEKYKFNGTLDCIGQIGEELILADWKTSKKGKKDKPEIYDEYITQVSAYVYLYNEVNKANINKAIILSLAKDDICYNLKELNKVELDSYFNEIFLPCLKIYNFQHRKKNVDKL